IGPKELLSDCRDDNQELIEVFENDSAQSLTNELENKKPNSLTGMSVLPTLRCNLKCVHCFYGSSPEGDYPMIDKNYIPLIVDSINQNNTENVTIGGGEPLIWEHIRDLLTKLLEKTNAKIFLLTNGLMLQQIEDLLQDFVTRFNVQVSVDAATEETYRVVRGGNFKLLSRNVRRLRDIGVDTALSYTIHSLNNGEVLPFIRMAEDIGIQSLHFPILEQHGRAKLNNIAPLPQELVNFYQFLVHYSFHHGRLKLYFVEELKLRLLRRMVRYNCSAADGQVAVGPDGYFYPCSELISDRFKICHIANYDNLRRFLRDFKTKTEMGSPVVEKICPECPVKLLCGGGCRAVELLSGKGYLEARPDPLVCDILINSVFTTLWEIVNNELNPAVSLDSLYTSEVLRMADAYEKTH
ncbi:MAG: radical SAM protein, partial [Candidatus Methanofastidiosum sp.]|nr:radical SAM protein [Methanofastidiosum sp.]